MSSFGGNLDNLLVQSLMGRLQLSSTYPDANGFLNETLDSILQEAASLSDSEDDSTQRSPLSKEEAKLEREIIRVILSGKTDSLQANSGQAVTIGDHHICVGFHDESTSGYRVWEWHGHIMLFDEKNGFSPEYIYGNYFERLHGKPVRGGDENDDVCEEKDTTGRTLGLRELISSEGSTNGRILQRNFRGASGLK